MPEKLLLRLVRPYSTAEEYMTAEGWSVGKTSAVLVGHAPIEPGTLVRCEVVLESGEPLLRVEGTVEKFIEPEGSRPGGPKLRFARMTPDTKHFIYQLLKRRATARRSGTRAAVSIDGSGTYAAVVNELESSPAAAEAPPTNHTAPAATEAPPNSHTAPPAAAPSQAADTEPAPSAPAQTRVRNRTPVEAAEPTTERSKIHEEVLARLIERTSTRYQIPENRDELLAQLRSRNRERRLRETGEERKTSTG